MLLLGKIGKKHPGDLPLMVADLPPTPVLFGKNDQQMQTVIVLKSAKNRRGFRP